MESNATWSVTTPMPTFPPLPYAEPYWIASEAVLVILTLGTIYLLYAMTYYACKLEKKNTTKRLVIICIVSVAAGLARLTSDHTVAFLGWQSDLKCRITSSVSVAFYSCSIYPVYVFLWYRQNAFYSSQTLKHLLNRHVQNISYATLSVLAGGGLIVTVLFQIPSVTGWDFRATSTGCRDAHDTQDVEVLPLMVILISTLGQVSLLGLLLYPLITTKRKQERMSQSSIVRPSPKRQLSGGSGLMRQAMHGAMKKREFGEGDVIETRKAVGESSLTLYNVGQHNALASSDDESVRSLSVYSGYSAYTSGSETTFTSDYTYTSRSEYESDQEMRRSSSKSVKTVTRKSTKTRNSQIFAKNSQTTPTRGRRDSGDSCRNSVCRRIRKRADSRKRRRHRRSKSEIRKERKMKLLIRKVFMLTTACVISDIFFTIAQLMFVVPELTYLMIFDINIFINIFCIILSFKDWKKILLSPFLHRRAQKRKDAWLHGVSQTKMTSLDHSNDSLKKHPASDAASLSSAGCTTSASAHTPERLPVKQTASEVETTVL